MTTRILQAQLSYYTLYLQEPRVGFALPLFHSPGDENLYVQIVNELSSKVDYFNVIESIQQPTPCGYPDFIVKAGDDPVYIFIDQDGDPMIGPAKAIASDLCRIMQNGSVPSGVCLQIAELFGTQEDKDRFRRIVSRSIVDKMIGPAAKASFLKSIEYQLIWDHQLREAATESDKLSVLKNRNKLIVSDVNDNVVESNVASDMYIGNEENFEMQHIESKFKFGSEYGVVTAEVEITNEKQTKELIIAGPWRDRKSELRVSPGGILYKNVKTIFYYKGEDAIIVRDQPDALGVELREMSNKIISLRRQEERISLFISYIVYQEKMWVPLVRGYYHDQGIFARMAIGLVKGEVLSTGLGNDPKHRNIKLIHLCERIVKSAFMHSKGRFVLGLSKHLGSNPDYRNFILGTFERHSSQSLQAYRPEIMRYLG